MTYDKYFIQEHMYAQTKEGHVTVTGKSNMEKTIHGLKKKMSQGQLDVTMAYSETPSMEP